MMLNGFGSNGHCRVNLKKKNKKKNHMKDFSSKKWHYDETDSNFIRDIIIFLDENVTRILFFKLNQKNCNFFL